MPGARFDAPWNGENTMSIHGEPHFSIPSAALADWLEGQGVDRWWTVDGDPLLTGRLSFPCPADELAAELRRINRTLLVQDRRRPSSGRGEQVSARDLDGLVTRLRDNLHGDGKTAPWADDRLLVLCWEDWGGEWLLVE